MINHAMIKCQFYGNQIRLFADASLNTETETGRIGIVVYSGNILFSTYVINDIPSRSVNVLELQAVQIGRSLYPQSKIHTDSEYAFRHGKRKLYIINGKYNPADKLLRNEQLQDYLDLHELVTNWAK